MRNIGAGKWAGLEDLIGLAQQQIGWQLGTFSSIDTKAAALIAFDGVLGAGLFFVDKAHSVLGDTAIILVAASVLTAILALWTHLSDVGPDAVLLAQVESIKSVEDLQAQLLVELQVAVTKNGGPIRWKSLLWKGAAVALGLAVTVLIVSQFTKG